MGVAHWDEVETFRLAKGEMDAVWQALGDDAGCTGFGLQRVRVEPGKLPTPPHEHLRSEELFFVLGGSGLLWQEGTVHEIRPGDCAIHRPRSGSHTLVAGPEGLEYLVFGTRYRSEAGWLPRSRALRVGPVWVEGRDDDPWAVEERVEPLAYGEPAPRPANLLNVDEVEPAVFRAQTTHSLAADGRSDLTGLHWERIAPGRRGSVPHCHSAEEEAFVILDGSATLELWPSRLRAVDERVELRTGHVVVRPPGTGVSHSFLAGREGVTMLVYGTRDPSDMCFYPRSNKISWRGLGVIGRIEPLDYFDGEPED